MMKTYVMRSLVPVLVAAALAAACSSASGDYEITMEFLDVELPRHEMGMMGMMGMDIWPVGMIPPVTFMPGDVMEIVLGVYMPTDKYIEVSKPSGAFIFASLSTMGQPDVWETSWASHEFLGVNGIPPRGPAYAETHYSRNGEGIMGFVDGFQESPGGWSFNQLVVRMDTSQLSVFEPKTYTVSLDFGLVESVDSGGPFSFMAPEPVTMSLLGLGAVGLLIRRRK